MYRGWWIGLCDQENTAEVMICDFLKHCSFCLGSHTLGKASPMRSSRARWRSTRQGTEASWQLPTPTCQPCEWAILGVEPLAPVTPTDDQALVNILASHVRISRTIHLNCSWIPDLERNCEISQLWNIYCFKPLVLKLFVIHTAIYITNQTCSFIYWDCVKF